MPVSSQRLGHAVVVTIDRPERRNALDGPTIEAIGTAFVAAEADDDVRAVVLTGSGDKAFCAGMDLKAPRDPVARGPGLGAFTNRCYPKPVIAAVNGAAVGGGFELMLAADLVVAADHATFAVPEVLRGLVGAGCTTRLAARLPPALVAELTFLGTPFDARRAMALGLVNQVVPIGDLLPQALALVDRLALAAPLALRVTKELIFREQGMHDDAEWRVIRAQAAPVFASDDAREGAAAFTAKRPPVWTGR
ncbi:MAG TPA: enoyl-CoA hydratase-related protein [Acidimicrobiales bacterium]|jgi:enoyl-CoA hydratase/carnithine racemase